MGSEFVVRHDDRDLMITDAVQCFDVIVSDLRGFAHMFEVGRRAERAGGRLLDV
jgi:hypothetical protein